MFSNAIFALLTNSCLVKINLNHKVAHSIFVISVDGIKLKNACSPSKQLKAYCAVINENVSAFKFLLYKMRKNSLCEEHPKVVDTSFSVCLFLKIATACTTQKSTWN